MANWQVETRGALFEGRFKSVVGSPAPRCLEDSLWLCPIEGRRWLDSSREGMLEGSSPTSDRLLVDYSGRFFRNGKVAISAELSAISGWIERSAEDWW
jgi:hypothetical protein